MRTKNQFRTWIIAGLVGGTIMSMLGPRPIFVRTAYAGTTVEVAHDTIAVNDVAIEVRD